jgi:ATP-dependent Lon protease
VNHARYLKDFHLSGTPKSEFPDPGKEEVSAIAPPIPKRARKPRTQKRTAGKRPTGLMLPTLIVDDMQVLPRLTVPFPVEDDETAYVFERACRSSKRLVFLVCERPVISGDTPQNPAAVDTEVFKEFFANMELEQAEGIEEGWIGEALVDQPGDYEICPVGIIAEVGQFGPPTSPVPHVMLQGISRGIVLQVAQHEPMMVCEVQAYEDSVPAKALSEAPMAALTEQIENYVSMHPGAPEDVLSMLNGIGEPGHLADLVAISPEFTPLQRQQIVELLDPLERLRAVSVIVEKRLMVLSLRNAIVADAQSGMDKQQREYFLREQIRSIQKELGEGTAEETLAKDLRQRVEDAGMPASSTR